jgi:cyclopropane fatty-acyl-phospholipid synthase-like methyltransferase
VTVERAGLLINDIEILRLHYADTLTAWRERFAKAASITHQPARLREVPIGPIVATV